MVLMWYKYRNGNLQSYGHIVIEIEIIDANLPYAKVNGSRPIKTYSTTIACSILWTYVWTGNHTSTFEEHMFYWLCINHSFSRYGEQNPGSIKISTKKDENKTLQPEIMYFRLQGFIFIYNRYLIGCSLSVWKK